MPASLPSTPVPRLKPSGCPGLLRIVSALDGGICRVRLTGGALTGRQARAIADASERFASGVIELTNRANVQLRGVRSDAHAPLIDALLAAALGPSHEGGDEVRNLMLSPSAGIDTAALIDTRPLADAILDRLQQDFGNRPASVDTDRLAPLAPRDNPLHNPLLAPLSPKFAIQLDGGEALAMIGHHHDIWLSAMPGPKQDIVFGIGLAGSPSEPGVGVGVGSNDTSVDRADVGIGTGVDSDILAVATAEQLPEVVSALIRCFLTTARADETRLRHMLARVAPQTLLAQLQAALPFALQAPTALPRWHRGQRDPRRRFGAVPQRSTPDDRRYYLGAQIALGRLTPDVLRGAAATAERFGDGRLRVTPWQGLLLPGVRENDRDAALDELRALGLIDSADDPLGAVLACAGRPDCAKARADTKRDARTLAAKLGQAVDVQLSGCERGCAAGRHTAFTLLAVADGRYDLYRAEPPSGASSPTQATNRLSASSASSGSASTSAFGTRIASHLTIEMAVPWLA